MGASARLRCQWRRLRRPVSERQQALLSITGIMSLVHAWEVVRAEAGKGVWLVAEISVVGMLYR